RSDAVQVEAGYDLVLFPVSERDSLPSFLKACAETGHRVFVVAPTTRADGPAFEAKETRPGVFAVTLRGSSEARLVEALDALRRGRALGATVAVLERPAWSPVAERLRRERAWPLVYELVDAPGAAVDESLVESADFALTTSPALEEVARRHHNRVM